MVCSAYVVRFGKKYETTLLLQAIGIVIFQVRYKKIIVVISVDVTPEDLSEC